MRKTIFLNKGITVLIVSAGGVGTTFLIEAINKYKVTNCKNNTDGYKHIPIPPISFNKNLRVVYVYGSPIHACISLFRRKYHHTQSIVVQKFLKEKYIIPFEMTLEEYVSNGKDCLLFEQHFNNWQQHYPLYPTLFLKYENIHDSLNTLAIFLDLPDSFVKNFPTKRTRKSSVQTLSPSALKHLNKLYHSFDKKIGTMPKYSINDAQKGIFSIKTGFSPLYRQALADAFFQHFPLLRKTLQS